MSKAQRRDHRPKVQVISPAGSKGTRYTAIMRVLVELGSAVALGATAHQLGTYLGVQHLQVVAGSLAASPLWSPVSSASWK